MQTYTVVLIPDVESGGFTVLVAAMPGCITHGETIDDALEQARDAIAAHIHGEDVATFVERERSMQIIIANVSVA